jgi:geranylgeranyl diphosphate synthase type II
MQIASYQLVAQTPAEYLKPVLDLFSQTAAEICEGQQYDVDFENRDEVKAEEYLEMIRLKTAVLLGCALQCGAWIGGAGEEDAQLLYDFGINIGLAFQLKDDLLDVYGDEATFGKRIGGDILCNKKTYLLINALKLAKGDDAAELAKWLKISDENLENEKINAVTSLYNKLDVKAICEDKMRDFYTKAVANLEKVSVLDNKKHELRKLADKLMLRND